MSETDESQYRLQAILDTAVDGIITIDDHGIRRKRQPGRRASVRLCARRIDRPQCLTAHAFAAREHHDEYISRYLRTGEARIIGIGRELGACGGTARRSRWSWRSAKCTAAAAHALPASFATSVRASRQRRHCGRARRAPRPFWTPPSTASSPSTTMASSKAPTRPSSVCSAMPPPN